MIQKLVRHLSSPPDKKNEPSANGEGFFICFKATLFFRRFADHGNLSLIIITTSKKKNGARTDSRDSIYIGKGETKVYELEY